MTGGTGAIKYIIKLNNNTIQIATNETNAINGTAEGLFAQGTAGTNNVNNFHAIVEERLPCSPGDKLGYASEGNGAGQTTQLSTSLEMVVLLSGVVTICTT